MTSGLVKLFKPGTLKVAHKVFVGDAGEGRHLHGNLDELQIPSLLELSYLF